MKRNRSTHRALTTTREAERHRLIGGALCLDFANTVNGHQDPTAHEYLLDFRDLVLWARHADAVGAPDARLLLRYGSANPRAAAESFRAALAMRETIFRVFTALAKKEVPARGDLEHINVAWREAQRHTMVASTPVGFALKWDDAPSVQQIGRAVSLSAVALLTSGRTGAIRQCAGVGCDWLFVDESRNHLRRWCSMDECGNRAKMRRRRLRNQGVRAL